MIRKLFAIVFFIGLASPGTVAMFNGLGHAATFTVTNTDVDGAGSLRDAIILANGNPGPDTIAFNIPLTDPDHFYYQNDGISGLSIIATTMLDDASITDFDPDYPGAPFSWYSIQPVATNLPSITDPVVIDGYTQPGALPNTNTVDSKLGLNTVLKIEIDGSLLGGAVPTALDINIDNTTVRGLVINRFAFFGIEMTQFGFPGPSPKIGNIIVEGNFIGTDVTGTMALGNTDGVSVGTANNRIGGTTPAARNLISGNGGKALGIAGLDSDGNVVQGNLIGTDVTGLVALGNTGNGVALGSIAGTNNLIGGTAPGARNVISGNATGVILGLANGNRVQGNFIGTDITDTVALGNNTGVGIGASDNNIIGGTAPGAGNVISGNTLSGVSIGNGSNGNQVEGNSIGTDETGSIDVGNGGRGVFMGPNVSNNTIGGLVPGAANIIAYNRIAGVTVVGTASTGNAILSNAIFANDPFFGIPGLGIDLAANSSDRGGVTPNDPGEDGDTGGNNLQNFPELTSAVSTPGNTTIEGTLNSTATTTFTLEFFANIACDPSGFGEGEALFGWTDVTTNVLGDVSFMVTFPIPVPSGDFVTATATSENNGNRLAPRTVGPFAVAA